MTPKESVTEQTFSIFLSLLAASHLQLCVTAISLLFMRRKNSASGSSVHEMDGLSLGASEGCIEGISLEGVEDGCLVKDGRVLSVITMDEIKLGTDVDDVDKRVVGTKDG